MAYREQQHAGGQGGETRGVRERQNRKSRTNRKARRGPKGRSAADNAGLSGAGEDAERVSLYDEVTDRIIAELEGGRVPWVQPWSTAACGPSLPRNALTGRSYSGVNVLILWGALIERDYPTQGWLTFKQARDAGGAVMKGERGTTVVYADRFTPEAEKTRAIETGNTAKTIPFLKSTIVSAVASMSSTACSMPPSSGSGRNTRTLFASAALSRRRPGGRHERHRPGACR